MKKNNLKKIKIITEDETKGFHILSSNDFSIFCLADNVYVVPEKALRILKKRKIKFELV